MSAPAIFVLAPATLWPPDVLRFDVSQRNAEIPLPIPSQLVWNGVVNLSASSRTSRSSTWISWVAEVRLTPDCLPAAMPVVAAAATGVLSVLPRVVNKTQLAAGQWLVNQTSKIIDAIIVYKL